MIANLLSPITVENIACSVVPTDGYGRENSVLGECFCIQVMDLLSTVISLPKASRQVMWKSKGLFRSQPPGKATLDFPRRALSAPRSSRLYRVLEHSGMLASKFCKSRASTMSRFFSCMQ
ncbi:hypothetical protein D3C78_1487020 [compost metagenome]